MSYLRLGNTQINYGTGEGDDRLIISQIVDSKCSYKDPKLIRSEQDLELFFGNSYPDYNYHKELLYYGATLYLYRPIVSDNDKFSDFIDYSKLEKFSLPQDSEIDDDYRKTKIFVDISELPDKGFYRGRQYIYSVLEGGDFNDYIYLDSLGEFIRLDKLPQNINKEEYTSGKLNRDTLRLTHKGWSKTGFSSCNPRYSTRNYTAEYPDFSSMDINSLLESINSEGIEEGLRNFDYYTLALQLDFSRVTEIKEGDFIVIPGPVGVNDDKIFVYDPNEENLFPVGDNEISGASTHTYWVRTQSEDVKDIIRDFIREIVECNESSWDLLREDSDESLIYNLWNKKGVVSDLQFYTINGLVIKKNFNLTQDLLSVLSEDKKRIEFYSKTVGPGDDDIKITINKISSYNKERYKIVVSRYSYSETFEGNLYLKEDNDGRVENLERIINSGSRLVECKLYQRSDYNIDNLDDGLIEGEFYLKRADEESYSLSGYYNALREMEREIRIKEDFLLIPNKKVYSEDIDLEFLLEYCNTSNCQALIVNHENDYLENLIEKDNRLVYFYNDMLYFGNSRPGYYVFIRGILDQTYTLPITGILYESPKENDKTIEDPYSDYLESFKRYKSNYLVYNEHSYYYRELFSHPGDYNYTLTILSRYCQSHVSKVVEREFPSLLGWIYSGEMLNKMNSILERIKGYNRIIKDLYIESVEKDNYNQKIDVYLHLDVRELSERDISLGIILNFNLS